MAFKSYYKLVKYKDPNKIPFYLEDVSGSTNTISIEKDYYPAPTLTIETSLDGTTWTTLGQTSGTALSISVPANGKVYVRCNTSAWCNTDRRYNYFRNPTGNFKVGGNIMSLLYGSNFTGNETTFPSGSSYTFACLFADYNIGAYLTDISELILPATTLVDYCYYYMFSSCSNLTSSPALPATTLANYCYSNMFYRCSSLTTAPELPATTLTNYCYQFMFGSCTSLSNVTCLATNISATGCTTNWLYDGSATGTFTKAASMTGWSRNPSGIPIGWTVQDAQ